jgi:hypothetical protein
LNYQVLSLIIEEAVSKIARVLEQAQKTVDAVGYDFFCGA